MSPRRSWPACLDARSDVALGGSRGRSERGRISCQCPRQRPSRQACALAWVGAWRDGLHPFAQRRALWNPNSRIPETQPAFLLCPFFRLPPLLILPGFLEDFLFVPVFCALSRSLPSACCRPARFAIPGGGRSAPRASSLLCSCPAHFFSVPSPASTCRVDVACLLPLVLRLGVRGCRARPGAHSDVVLLRLLQPL